MKKHVCPWWFAYTFDNPARRLFHKPEEMFAPYLDRGMTAVDLGCGLGYFSIAMARMVGNSGRILAVDLQEKMLKILAKRADKAGVAPRITTHQCHAHDIGITAQVDFALAFWMAHETPHEPHFVRQVQSILKKGGILYLAEPKVHVPPDDFQITVAAARQLGLQPIATPQVALSRTVVFQK